MQKKWLGLIGLVATILVLTGCAGPSRLEMDFGTSVKLAKTNQILNPEAGKNLEPVTGFDGKAAQATMEKYWKDFGKPAPPTVYNFSIGDIGK